MIKEFTKLFKSTAFMFSLIVGCALLVRGCIDLIAGA